MRAKATAGILLALAAAAIAAHSLPLYKHEKHIFLLGDEIEGTAGGRWAFVDPVIGERLQRRGLHFEQQLGAPSGTYPLPIYGSYSVTGSYYAHVELGTPGQMQVLLCDTGSSDLAVFSAGCVGCPSQPSSAWYNPANSPSYQALLCNAPHVTCQGCERGTNVCLFEDSYGDGSYWLGAVSSDAFAIPNTTLAATIQFGKIVQAGKQIPTSYFQTGIWGLAFGALSAWGGIPAFTQLVDDGELYPAFSMCLGSMDKGTMTLGMPAVDLSLFQFTPIVTDTYYTVNLTGLATMGSTISATAMAANNFTIFDSGTTVVILAPAILSELRDIWTASCKRNKLVGLCGLPEGQTIFDGNCFVMTEAEVAAYPAIEFQVANITNGFLSIGPDAYLVPQVSNGVTYYCLYVASLGDTPISILGETFLSQYHVLYDVANNRVGVGSVDTCPYVPHPPYIPAPGPAPSPSKSGPWHLHLLLIIVIGGGVVLVGAAVAFIVYSRRSKTGRSYREIN